MKHITVTDKNKSESNKILNSAKPLMILFFSNSCGHCIQFKPEWDAFKKISPIETVEVESSYLQQTPEKLRANLIGYPTVKFKEGNMYKEYEGNRTKEDLKLFIETNIKPASKSASKPKTTKSKKVAKK